jgi:hypothetical protein
MVENGGREEDEAEYGGSGIGEAYSEVGIGIGQKDS